MAELELTNMVMVQDKLTNKLLVQNRIKKWCGISFPGGHVEDDESIYDSAIREIKEETGLDINNLKFADLCNGLTIKLVTGILHIFIKPLTFKHNLRMA